MRGGRGGVAAVIRSVFRAIRHEFMLKVLSLVIAVSLWAYVVGTRTLAVATRRSVPVQVTNIGAGLQYTDLKPARVSVFLEGPRRVLYSQVMSAIRAEANLAGRGPGVAEVPLSLTGIPKDVNVVQAPTAVTVSIEKTSDQGAAPARSVPVWAVFGPTAPGHQISRVEVSPSTVVVTGDLSRLRDVQYVRTAKLDILALKGTGEFSVELEAPEGLRLIGAQSVTVSVVTTRRERPTTEETGAAPEVQERASEGANEEVNQTPGSDQEPAGNGARRTPPSGSAQP
jgi:YbbR domain-containing protein